MLDFAVGGEGAKAEAFRAFWEAGAPLAGDKGAKGWAAWESQQGLDPHSPAPQGVPMDDSEVTPGQKETEQKGGWGEWVPLMPDTPMDPKALPAHEAEAEAEAGSAADEVRQQAGCQTMYLCTV